MMQKIIKFRAGCGDFVTIVAERIKPGWIKLILETSRDDFEEIIIQRTQLAIMIGRLCEVADFKIKNQLELDL